MELQGTRYPTARPSTRVERKVRLKVHRFLQRTEAEGPGIRSCVWVQGCSIRCPGCFNTPTWNPDEGTDEDPADLAQRVVATAGIEGLTFLGGEPFDQAEACSHLAKLVRARGLSVMTFTGYKLEDLKSRPSPAVHDFLSNIDLLVDGPFKLELVDNSRPWVGSSNQQFHFLTARYRELEERLTRIPNRVEVRLLPDGSTEVNGMAPKSMLAALRRSVRGT